MHSGGMRQGVRAGVRAGVPEQAKQAGKTVGADQAGQGVDMRLPHRGQARPRAPRSSAARASASSTTRKCGDICASSGKRRSSDWQKAWMVPMRMPPGRSSTRTNSARASARLSGVGVISRPFQRGVQGGIVHGDEIAQAALQADGHFGGGGLGEGEAQDAGRVGALQHQAQAAGPPAIWFCRCRHGRRRRRKPRGRWRAAVRLARGRWGRHRRIGRICVGTGWRGASWRSAWHAMPWVHARGMAWRDDAAKRWAGTPKRADETLHGRARITGIWPRGRC